MLQRRVIVNRAIACVINITFFAFFIYQSTKCVVKYVKKETSTHLDILSTKSAHFPQLTICPDYGYAYKEDILQLYNSTAKEIRSFIYPVTENLTSYQFHDLVTYDINEVLDSMEIVTAQSMKDSTFKVRYSFGNVSQKFRKNDWTESRYNTFGRCFSYNTPEFIQKSEVRNFTVFYSEFRSLLFIDQRYCSGFQHEFCSVLSSNQTTS